MFKITLAPALGMAAGAALLSACAVNGHSPLKRSAPVKIVTAPAGALAESEYGDSCVTPCSLRLLMSRGGAIRITKEGYEDYEVDIGSRVSKTKAAIGGTANAAYYLDDPSPVDAVIDALELAVNPDAQYRDLDQYSIVVRLTPLGGLPPEEESEESADPYVDENGVILLNPSKARR